MPFDEVDEVTRALHRQQWVNPSLDVANVVGPQFDNRTLRHFRNDSMRRRLKYLLEHIIGYLLDNRYVLHLGVTRVLVLVSVQKLRKELCVRVGQVVPKPKVKVPLVEHHLQRVFVWIRTK